MNKKTYLFAALLPFISACSSDEDGTGSKVELVNAFTLQTVKNTSFFVIEKNKDSIHELQYTSSAAFAFDDENYLINDNGSPVRIFHVNSDGSSSSTSLSTSELLKLDFEENKAKATSKVITKVGLPNGSKELDIEKFDNNDPLTYNHATSVIVFDSEGDEQLLTYYFLSENSESNTWPVKIALNEKVVATDAPLFLDFTESGEIDLNDSDLDGFISTDNGVFNDISVTFTNGAEALKLTIDFTGSKSNSANFGVFGLSQNGHKQDFLDKLSISKNGLITVSFVNSDDLMLGRLALATFENPTALTDVENGLKEANTSSGEAKIGDYTTGNYGEIVPVIHQF